MIPMEVRKIIIADYDDGMKVEAISRAVRVSTLAIYRLFEKKQRTGTIEPSYQNNGRQSEVTAEKLQKMADLIGEKQDITLAEIKETILELFCLLYHSRLMRFQSLISMVGSKNAGTRFLNWNCCSYKEH